MSKVPEIQNVAAELIVFEGGTHALVMERADQVAPHIDRYLAT